jgi:CDP-diacylglycerol--glycerol-3-phosphate 3-phosphatidyltransferase
VPERRLTLPNIITLVRIALCPVIWWLVVQPGTTLRLAGFVVFLGAALSDVWDGYLARKHGWITDMGKLLDPLADKLLLVVTLVPVYLISHRPGELNEVPFWGPLPLWVLVVIFGRELFMTLFRQYATRRSVVIAAGSAGKRKALLQNFFVGGVLLWWPIQQFAADRDWFGSGPWTVWSWIHRSWVGVTLALAVLLTVHSLVDYLWRYRALFSRGRGGV